jgi:hypothetical protein
MQTREWLFYTEDLMLAALPEELPRFQRRVMWTILQFYRDDPRIHFELQPQPSRSLVEVGLHFESTAEQNEAWAARVTVHSSELQSVLGPEWELEEWTGSWRRLHRVYRFERLDGQLGREIAAEWARAITLLWPFASTDVAAPAPFYLERSVIRTAVATAAG